MSPLLRLQRQSHRPKGASSAPPARLRAVPKPRHQKGDGADLQTCAQVVNFEGKIAFFARRAVEAGEVHVGYDRCPF